MKKPLVVLALLLAGALPARAGIYYDLQQTASSATLRMVGAFKMYAASFGSTPVVQIDQTGFSTTQQSTFSATGVNYSVVTSSGINVGTNAAGGGGVYAAFFKAVTGFYGNLIGNVTGNLTGNVVGNVTGVTSQATIWDHTPTKCGAGNYPLGTDTGGNAVNCTAAGIGDVTQAGANAFTGANTSLGSFTALNLSTFTVSTQTIVNGTWGVINSTTPIAGGVASYVFTLPVALDTGTTLELDFNINAITANDGDLYIRFNADTGNNYWSAIQIMSDAGAGGGSDALSGGSYCILHRRTDFDITDVLTGFVKIYVYPSNNKKAMAVINTALESSALSRGEANQGSCRYLGSAAITSITLGRTAGFMVGNARLIRIK